MEFRRKYNLLTVLQQIWQQLEGLQQPCIITDPHINLALQTETTYQDKQRKLALCADPEMKVLDVALADFCCL